jgi:putative transposase
MKRHSAEEVITKLRQAEADLAQGFSVGQVCQKLAISEQTLHRWRHQYGGLKQEPNGSRSWRRRTPASSVSSRSWPWTSKCSKRSPKKVVTARQRRRGARWLRERFDDSERRACRLLGQHRSTQRQPSTKNQETLEAEERLTRRMLELVRQHPRYGYRRVWVLLRREGWRVKRKRVYRLWKCQGLKVPRKQRKKRRLGSSANSCARRPAEYKDHV